MNNKLISKKDLILLAALLFAALLVFSAFGKIRSKGNYLIVTRDGEVVVRELLTEEKEIRIESEDGGYNIIRIIRTDEGNFAVMCSESNCPEKICVNKGQVVLTDDPIVCLPHKMTAKLVKKQKQKQKCCQ
ncbi:MAG: NusG domain II-containing protein [Lachnospiraceae bacterium]|nr:NusG domain II-containing protein [Lachnospiraceae bacterium]